MSATQALAFAAVILVGAMSPGPDFAVVVRRSAVSGRLQGMAAAGGIALGVFVWVIAAAVGVAALLAASAVAFTVVKVIGGAYLLYLGVKALRAAIKQGKRSDDIASAPATNWKRAFLEGLITNAANPKAAMFLMALVPQFMSEPAALQTLTLAGIALVVTYLWFTVLANLVGALRRLFARSAVRRAIEATTGAALVALGVRVAAAPQP